jgi:mRNA degradation ribonuclease J1/J2
VTGSQGHANSSLGKALEGKSGFLTLDKEKDVIVFNAPSMPGTIGLRERFLSDLREKGFTVITKKELPLYSPAHARIPELVEMVKLADPKHVLPIHGSAHLREAAATVVSKMGRKAVRADNGDVLAVSRRGVKSTAPATKGAPPLIGLKTLQGMGKDGWKDRYYLQVNAPQKAAPPETPANGNKKHRPQIFNINP